jgi:hypothetical protein
MSEAGFLPSSQLAKLLLAISKGHAIISAVKAALCRTVSPEVKVG